MQTDERFWREVTYLCSLLGPVGHKGSLEATDMLGRWAGQFVNSGPEKARSALWNTCVALEAARCSLGQVVIPYEQDGDHRFSYPDGRTQPTVESAVAGWGYHAKYFWICVAMLGKNLSKGKPSSHALFAELFTSAASCYRGKAYAVPPELRSMGLSALIEQLEEGNTSTTTSLHFVEADPLALAG